jgi:hypothetical protein
VGIEYDESEWMFTNWFEIATVYGWAKAGGVAGVE